jgi:thiosulfate/3-mercaptopyruvate sulfurtransferase
LVLDRSHACQGHRGRGDDEAAGQVRHRTPLHRDAAALRGVFSATDLDGEDELITYCTIGGRACTAWFVLAYLLGRDRVRVYDGSWAEWGRMPEAPVEQA